LSKFWLEKCRCLNWPSYNGINPQSASYETEVEMGAAVLDFSDGPTKKIKKIKKIEIFRILKY